MRTRHRACQVSSGRSAASGRAFNQRHLLRTGLMWLPTRGHNKDPENTWLHPQWHRQTLAPTRTVLARRAACRVCTSEPAATSRASATQLASACSVAGPCGSSAALRVGTRTRVPVVMLSMSHPLCHLLISLLRRKEMYCVLIMRAHTLIRW